MSARIGATLAGLLLLTSCDALPDESAASPGVDGGAQVGEGNVGSFSMNLTVGSAFRFNEIGYDVSGNGFRKTGSINVAGSSTVSAIIGNIPFGAGYVLTLTAQDVDHKLAPCMGSASFEISSTAIVPVPVSLSCHEVPAVAVPVPVPPWARFGLAGLLLAVGALAVRRQRALTLTTSSRNI